MVWGEGGVVPEGIPVPDIGAEVPLLHKAVDRFVRRVEREFNPAEMGEQIIVLSRARDIISRELAKLVAAFAATDEYERQGANSPIDWVRIQANMSVVEAAHLDVVGRHLEQLPLSSAAMDAGAIGFGHLVNLARNAAFSARSKGAFDEVPLLPLARVESVNRFRHTCVNARHAQDKGNFNQAEVDAVESRELTINPLQDGTTWFNVRLDSTAAAITQAVLESRAGRLGPDDHRTKARRMADAFADITQGPLDEVEGGEVVGRRVQISVTCTAATLLDLAGAPAAEIEFGQPISGATVGRLACNAGITKILLDDRLIPVAVGRMKRTLTRRERKALNARDGHCRYPGCHRPPSQCEGHHVEWYSRGGKTRLSNMLLLCSQHHWRVHEGGWRLALAPDGAVVVVPPSSTTSRADPAGGWQPSRSSEPTASGLGQAGGAAKSGARIAPRLDHSRVRVTGSVLRE